MSEVNLMIDGKTYSIACDDGQERRVQQLGSYIDQRLKEISNGAGTSNKAQLMVLTSLLLADEIFELRDTVTEAANANVPQQIVYQGLTPNDEKQITSAIGKLASRVERLTARVQKA